jgi:hypothetical protein
MVRVTSSPGFQFGNRAVSILDGMRNSDFTVQVVSPIDDNLGPNTLSMLDQSADPASQHCVGSPTVLCLIARHVLCLARIGGNVAWQRPRRKGRSQAL